MPSLETRLRRLEARLQGLERIHATRNTRRVLGLSQAEIDKTVANLRQAGFTGEIRTSLLRIEFVSPPPMDEDGNIIGPTPPPVTMDEIDAMEGLERRCPELFGTRPMGSVKSSSDDHGQGDDHG